MMVSLDSLLLVVHVRQRELMAEADERRRITRARQRRRFW